jgi:1-acyl-sn-glycerol-3-phosphate acyltransferase
MRLLLQKLIEAVFRVLFTYDCLGEEKLPERGPAIVAANHPSYLDPILLSLQTPRPIRFMAWNALFRVPLLGSVIRAFGAFPVDIRRGSGRAAYAQAKALVDSGEIVGIFPEGRRSRTGWMEPALRAGAARLALETGAPLYPATIAGAYRAWPHYQSLPKPARIRVRYHDPIDPTAYQALPEEQAVDDLLTELRRRVDTSLLPGVKADLRTNVLFRQPAPFPRTYETLPPLVLALLVFWQTRTLISVLPAYAYIAYLLLDRFAIPQRRIVKWLRNASPVLFLLAYGPSVLSALGLPAVDAGEALIAVVVGAMFPYLYERGRVALGFMRGMTIACCTALGALYLWPSPIGAHVSLPLSAAAYAWAGRTVFYRYTVPILVAYALGGQWFIGGDVALLPHATAGLFAWVLGRILPAGRSTSPAAEAASTDGPIGLGLLDEDE